MRNFLAFALTASAIAALAAITVVLMIKITGERPSWFLVGVFVLDAAVLVALAARATLGCGSHRAGSRSALP